MTSMSKFALLRTMGLILVLLGCVLTVPTGITLAMIFYAKGDRGFLVGSTIVAGSAAFIMAIVGNLVRFHYTKKERENARE